MAGAWQPILGTAKPGRTCRVEAGAGTRQGCCSSGVGHGSVIHGIVGGDELSNCTRRKKGRRRSSQTVGSKWTMLDGSLVWTMGVASRKRKESCQGMPPGVKCDDNMWS